MDVQRGLLNWTYFYQDKSMDELKQSLLLTMELEDAKLKAQEDLKLRDEQITHLKQLLHTTIKQRDEAQQNYQKLFLENLLLQKQLQSEISSIEDEPRKPIDSNNGFSSSDCDESNVSSQLQVEEDEETELLLPVEIERALPEKGKLLEAVMKAGPLLQTLLLAGPLPRWRHPPPPLETYQIPPPPVIIPSPPILPALNRKRGFICEGSDSSTNLKYQRGVL
ncbi:hypothetical protein ACJIZ3_017311 [Penstemon smallii]|uniref:Uncharacterized protein n=1 Tax=Penstemon smallii TaxID=265156 RepID=A0ABD3SV70_9LAMI